MVTIALATLKRSLHTEALTFLFLVTNTGKAIGVAAIFVLHTRLLQINHAVLSENVPPTSERLRRVTMPETWDLDTVGGLATIAVEIGRQAELIAYLNDFLVIGVICLGILPLIAFLKSHRWADVHNRTNIASRCYMLARSSHTRTGWLN